MEADIEDVDHHIPFTRSMDELRSGEWLSNSKLCAESEAIFSSRGHVNTLFCKIIVFSFVCRLFE